MHNQTTRMLIVEDDLAVGTGLQDFFEMEGYAVTRVLDGEDGLQQITSLPPYDIVLLDVMLPEKNGFDVLRDARRMGVGSPIIILTARDSPEERLQGFELGADDYVTKPFSAEELGARVKAVLRRSQGSAAPSLTHFRFGNVVLDFDDHTATVADKQVPFTTLEFDILRYFIRHRGRTISRKQLLRDVWGISGDITTRTIDRHVASIRKKIEPVPKQPRYIETVYGIGYKFVEDGDDPAA